MLIKLTDKGNEPCYVDHASVISVEVDYGFVFTDESPVTAVLIQDRSGRVYSVRVRETPDQVYEKIKDECDRAAAAFITKMISKDSA